MILKLYNPKSTNVPELLFLTISHQGDIKLSIHRHLKTYMNEKSQ